MKFHRLYRQTMTETNAIVTVVDYIRELDGYGMIGNFSRQRRMGTALKVLEKRLSLLRGRAARNRANRGKNQRSRMPIVTPITLEKVFGNKPDIL